MKLWPIIASLGQAMLVNACAATSDETPLQSCVQDLAATIHQPVIAVKNIIQNQSTGSCWQIDLAVD